MNAREPIRPLTVEAIEAARVTAMSQMRSLIAVLEEQSGLAPGEFIAQVGELFAYPILTMNALQVLEPAFDLLPYTECAQRGVVAGRDVQGSVHFVFSDPFDGALQSWAEYAIPSPFDACLAHRDDIAAYLAQQEERLRAMQDIMGDEKAGGEAEVVDDISLVLINEDASPVVKLVNSTIYDALKLQASDIHLECDAGCLYIKYRIDGVLVQVGQADGLSMAEQVISRIKVMADLDIAERRVPQDGRFKVRIKGREIDFRVSIMPNIFGEDAVLRLLDRQSLSDSAKSLRLDSLGLDADIMAGIRRLAAKPHGMLLVTGPTGSGKTTTLYAAITEIHTGRDKIVTIEDPVEYRLPRVLQIPVNEKKGLTFARGLRSILRHDPDKIMVGEIRDDETAQIAVQAALTGHLVFTTVHANNVFDVLGRFLHMGVDPYSFTAALNGIVAQRLLRLNCPQCAADAEPTEADLAEAGLTSEDVRGWLFRAGKGCGHCRGTGYRGRNAVAEVLILNDTLRELIATKAPASRLKEEAGRTGMRSLRETALAWVARGETTLAEVSRVAG
jgi:general secretion pathway protein E